MGAPRFAVRPVSLLLVLVASAVLVGVLSTSVLADAPDPVLDSIHGSAHRNTDGSVTLTIDGGWQWTTHHSDCNTNRAGVGVAVDWNDSNQPGNVVTTLNGVTIDVGAAAAQQTATSPANPVDNVVHPTPGTYFHDVATPSDYASWRSGCGTYSSSLGYNSGTWGPFSHTYLPGTTSFQVCALMYDVHGKNTSNNPPSGAGEITAGASGHNKDNSAQSNSNTPLGNGCFTHTFTFQTTSMTTSATASVTVGSPIGDSATLAGAESGAHGSITFKAYGPDDTSCSGTAAFMSSAVNVTNGNGTYGPVSFTPTSAGTYRWRAFYSGDSTTTPPTDMASTACNDANETSTVNKAGPSGKSAQRLTPNDSATITGTHPTGSITFSLFGPDDANCSGTVKFTQTVTVNGNGTYRTANPGQTGAPFVAGAGTWKWLVTYSGDADNAPTASACGVEHFVVTEPA